MNLNQAITLADQLRAEAADEGIDNVDYSLMESANDTEVWAVKSTDTSNGEALEVWTAPDISFPL